MDSGKNLVVLKSGSRRVAVNRLAVLYIYEIDSSRCAIVVAAKGENSPELFVTVDGNLDIVCGQLEGPTTSSAAARPKAPPRKTAGE